MPTPCFIVERTGKEDRVIETCYFERCGSGRPNCVGISAVIEAGAPESDPDLLSSLSASDPSLVSHPECPRFCDYCGGDLARYDFIGIRGYSLWKRAGAQDSDSFRYDAMPVGAMFCDSWRAQFDCNAEAHGKPMFPLSVKLPDGTVWCVDSVSIGGGFWDRSGTPPNISANPSILVPGKYHGYLRNGVLTDPLPN